MGPGPGRALGPGPAAGPGPCSRPRAQGPVRARPHVRIDGSYCMYICIYVYMYIYIYIYIYIFRIPTFSVSRKTHFQDSHFRRFTENTFSGFPLSAPAQTYFRFCFFYDFWCPEPWEIVGIGGNRVKLSPKPGESWEIVGRSWEIVEMVPNP